MTFIRPAERDLTQLVRESDLTKDPHTLYKTQWEADVHKLMQSFLLPPDDVPLLSTNIRSVAILEVPPPNISTRKKVHQKRKIDLPKPIAKRKKNKNFSIVKLENMHEMVREKIAAYDRIIQRMQIEREEAYREYSGLSEQLRHAYKADGQEDVVVPEIVSSQDHFKKLKTAISKQVIAAIRECL